MKPISLIISLLLVVFSLLRLAQTCDKKEKRERAFQFNSWINRIDQERDSVMAYRLLATDSVVWMREHRKRMDLTLDSAIAYYRENYRSDEERHKAYLAILYDYKKLSYLYADWITASRSNQDPNSRQKEFTDLSYNNFRKKEQVIMRDISSHQIDLMMLD